LAAAVVAGAVTVSAMNVEDSAAPLSGPPAMVAAAMRLPAPDCSPNPVTADATDAVIFLTDATDRQRSELGRALNDDKRISSVVFESREEFYASLVKRLKASPDFLAAVHPESVPESYRVRLHDRDQFATFSREYAKKPGVQDIVGHVCPDSAPVGGAL
jgi:hypothetical protein